MHKLSSFLLPTCGIVLTVALAAARGDDKAEDYLKEGKLKERIEVLNDGLLTDGLGRSGFYIVIEPDGSWTSGAVVERKRQESQKGNLTKEGLAQLAKALGQHNLANLPDHAGKGSVPAAGSFTKITLGKKSATFSGQPDSDEGKKIFARYRGIETALRQLTVEGKAKKE